MAHCTKGQHTVVSAAIRQAFNQPDQNGAVEVSRHVADQRCPRWPKLATLMDKTEADVPALHDLPDPGSQHHPIGTPEQRGEAPRRRSRDIPERGQQLIARGAIIIFAVALSQKKA